MGVNVYITGQSFLVKTNKQKPNKNRGSQIIMLAADQMFGKSTSFP